MKTSIFKFCESVETFGRAHLEGFILQHPECKRMSDSIKVSEGDFSLGLSREFIARSMSCGYLDGIGCAYWVKDKRKKPYLMSLHATKSDAYFNEMVNLESLSDSDFFGEPLIHGSVASTNDILMMKRILNERTSRKA